MSSLQVVAHHEWGEAPCTDASPLSCEVCGHQLRDDDVIRSRL